MEDQLETMFHDIGIQVSGIPYAKPGTVHWNLRGDTNGFASTAHAPNVQMVQGYSAALFDLILCGKPEATPYETMRRKLDSPRYDLVREAFNRARPSTVQISVSCYEESETETIKKTASWIDLSSDVESV